MSDVHGDLDKALNLLGKLCEFAQEQNKRGLVDGACDPDIYVYEAINLIDKYGILEYDDDFALRV